jgi:hypothetical protein
LTFLDALRDIIALRSYFIKISYTSINLPITTKRRCRCGREQSVQTVSVSKLVDVIEYGLFESLSFGNLLRILVQARFRRTTAASPRSMIEPAATALIGDSSSIGNMENSAALNPNAAIMARHIDVDNIVLATETRDPPGRLVGTKPYYNLIPCFSHYV